MIKPHLRIAIYLLGFLLTSYVLTSCGPVEELKEECAAGNADACDILDTIGAAIDELEDAVPSDLTLASAFEEAEDYLSASKVERITEALDADVIERDGLVACLRALPPPPPVRDPQCYGPRLNYTNHPNFVSGQPAADGQLPSGDLGIWLDTEPTPTASGNAPCAAVKMNELISKAIHNVDMATGSVAMMMCAAAHERISAPKNNGDILDFSTVLNSVPNSPFTITTATLERVSATQLKTVFVAQHDGGNNNRLGTLSITTTHDSTTKTGLVQIERSPQNMTNTKIATSARYRPKPTDAATLQIQIMQGRFDTAQTTSFYDTQGDVKLGPITGNPNRNIEDTHYFVAEFNPTSGAQKIAYGWNAGGNDSHYHVFNAETDTTTADAWYGYAPNPYQQGGSSTVGETPNLDLSATNAGMICNWAGPGNSHTVNGYLQHQSMTKNGQDKWILGSGGSLIRYVPTVACDIPTNTNSTFNMVLNNNLDSAAQQAHDIASGQALTLTVSANGHLDDKANHNVDLPDASW